MQTEAVKLAALYPILDAEMAAARGHDIVACARGMAALGIETQQLRAKTLSSLEFLRLAERLVKVVPRLIVNDRADIARLSGAAGVHLGQEDLPVEAARGLGPEGWIVGVSTHNPEQAAAAAAAAPSYLALGPVFSTASKRNPDPVVGVLSVERLRARYAGPLVGIGGIGLENCTAVWSAGADAVAVISALWQTPDPVASANEFLLAFTRFSCHSPGESPRSAR